MLYEAQSDFAKLTTQNRYVSKAYFYVSSSGWIDPTDVYVSSCHIAAMWKTNTYISVSRTTHLKRDPFLVTCSPPDFNSWWKWDLMGKLKYCPFKTLHTLQRATAKNGQEQQRAKCYGSFSTTNHRDWFDVYAGFAKTLCDSYAFPVIKSTNLLKLKKLFTLKIEILLPKCFFFPSF